MEEKTNDAGGIKKLLSVFIAISMFFVAFNAVELAPLLNQKLLGEEVEAEIVRKIREASGGRTIEYQFEVSGQTYSGRSPFPRKRWAAISEGDRIAVQYLAKNPNSSSIAGFDLKTIGAIWDLFLSVCLVAIFWYVIRVLAEAAADTENGLTDIFET